MVQVKYAVANQSPSFLHSIVFHKVIITEVCTRKHKTYKQLKVT